MLHRCQFGTAHLLSCDARCSSYYHLLLTVLQWILPANKKPCVTYHRSYPYTFIPQLSQWKILLWLDQTQSRDSCLSNLSSYTCVLEFGHKKKIFKLVNNAIVRQLPVSRWTLDFLVTRVFACHRLFLVVCWRVPDYIQSRTYPLCTLR